MKKIFIGTSGFSYAHWDKVFYPEDLPSNKHLNYYAEFFNTVELNTTFYHLPLIKTVKNWHTKVPVDFIFSVKASRYITHVKKLVDSEEALVNFYASVKFLRKKLGPILFQLPPSFSLNLARLESFVELLDRRYSYTFEFRHPTWYVQKVYSFLQSKNIALCVTDLNGKLSPLKTTADFTYTRLHGPKRAYKGRYSKSALTQWKTRILEWSKTKNVYIYFDNDEKSYAVKDGLVLKEMLKQSLQ